MSFALLFAILILLWAISLFRGEDKSWQKPGNIILFVMLLMLGWKVFGAPLHP